MSIIKELPEDFVVEEVSSVEPQPSGPYTLFQVKKRDYSTGEALKKVAQALRVSLKSLGYAGNKDRRAVTTQVCSAKLVSKEKLSSLSLKDIEVTFLGYSGKPVSLGDLKGNNFTISVRDLDAVMAKKIGDQKTVIVPNYFDEQRFSTDNVAAGRMILKRDFLGAAKIIARTHPEVAERLAVQPSNGVGALAALPKKTLRIYLHAYQSLLFNELLTEYIKNQYPESKSVSYSQGAFLFPKIKENPEIVLPLIGFGTEYADSWVEEKSTELLKRDGLTLRSFVIKEFPELSSEGTVREAFVLVEVQAEIAADDLHAGKKKATLKFSLPPGSYATIVVKALSA